jgi:hypothetical protein
MTVVGDRVEDLATPVRVPALPEAAERFARDAELARADLAHEPLAFLAGP